MKVEDLMLGDWVQVEGIPLRVGGLSNYDIYVDLFRGNESEVYSQIWADEMDSIQPIPITPEILQKNGFEYLKNCGYEYYDDVVLVRYDTWNERLIIMNNLDVVFDSKDYSSMCVHELQHALRLCGIEKEIVL